MQQELEYVYEVYKDKNFTRAAEKLYITQPALSMAIQKVEEKLGMPIFDRNSRPISLTEAGEAYLQHIMRVRQLETELSQQIQDIKELDTGTITIGGSHYLNACILPSVLAGFMSKYPKVNVILKEASSAELSEKLANQEIDLTFHCSPEFIQDFTRFPAFQDHILLAVPKNMDHFANSAAGVGAALSAKDVIQGKHLEADCPAVHLAEYSDLPFILLSKGNNLYERGVQMFEEAGFLPNMRLKLSQLVTAYHLADAGIGATFVSDRETSGSMERLNYYRIDSALTERQFYILLPKRKYVSAAARKFIEYFRENIG